MAKTKRRTIQAVTRQTGKTNIVRDRKRGAMLPGKRISASGKKYYENRKNRSDLKNEKV